MTSHVEISKRLLLINSASSIGAQVLQFSVLIWLHQHLLRRISSDEYSLYPLVMAIVSFVPLFAGILTAGLGRYIIDAYARGDEDRIREIVSAMVPLLLAASLLLLFLGGLAAWCVDWILVIPKGLIWDARLMIGMLVFSLAVQLPCTPLSVGLYVRQRFVVTSVISIVSEIIRSTVLLILLLLVSTRILWVVVAMVVGQMFALVINMVFSLRAVPALGFRYRGVNWEVVRVITGFGGWSFLVGVAARTREFAIPFVLNHWGTATDVASYQIGSLGRRQIDQWFDVAARPIYPIIIGMYSAGATERFRNAYLRAGRVALWIILLAALPAVIYAEPLIRLYAGDAYAEAATVLALTLACYILSSGNWMVWGMAMAKAQIRPLSIRVCLAQLSGVLGILVLTGWLGLGAIGAAMASFTLMILSDVFLLLPVGLRLAEVKLDPWIRRTLVPGLAPGCAAAVVWVWLGLIVKPDSWLELAWCTAIGVLCYAAVLLRCCLELQDKQDLAKIVAKVRRVVGPTGRAPIE